VITTPNLTIGTVEEFGSSISDSESISEGEDHLRAEAGLSSDEL